MAQQDAPMVMQGDHTGQVPDDGHERRIEVRLGQLVINYYAVQASFGTRHEAFGPSQEGMSSKA